MSNIDYERSVVRIMKSDTSANQKQYLLGQLENLETKQHLAATSTSAVAQARFEIERDIWVQSWGLHIVLEGEDFV